MDIMQLFLTKTTIVQRYLLEFLLDSVFQPQKKLLYAVQR